MKLLMLCVCIGMIVLGVRHAVKANTGDGFNGNEGDDKNKFNESNSAVQEAFANFIETLFKGKGVTIYSPEITGTECLATVPYQDGNFYFERLSYAISYDENSEVLNGMNLSSKELIAAAGITDNLLALYFKGSDGIPCEATIVQEKKAKLLGFAQHIARRYGHITEKTPLEEYGIVVEGRKICLWQNLKGELNLSGVERSREVLNNTEASKGHYKDIYKSGDIEIYSWVQFERRSELVEKIILKSDKAETAKGIRVGDSVAKLKATYSTDLSYVSDLGGYGPAYGYIPEDGSQAYTAFRIMDGKIIEILISDSKLRPFMPKEGYVEQDVPWIPVDYLEKKSDVYARELYLGRHNEDLDPAMVLDRFLKKTFSGGSVFDSGIWKESNGADETLYYAIWEDEEKTRKVYMDVILKKLKIENYVNETNIWVVSKYKVQEKGK